MRSFGNCARSATASSPIVSDASLVVDLLVDEGERGEWALALFGAAGSVCAPHVLDVEVLAALRGLVSSDRIALTHSANAVRNLGDLPIVRYPSTHLLERIWQLRGTLTPYDAAYVALAEALAAPLVTLDLRLARAGGHRAEIIAFGG